VRIVCTTRPLSHDRYRRLDDAHLVVEAGILGKRHSLALQSGRLPTSIPSLVHLSEGGPHICPETQTICQPLADLAMSGDTVHELGHDREGMSHHAQTMQRAGALSNVRDHPPT
jgi:hypothetical protein